MKTVAFIGLLMNTVGTALVWKFGLPQDIDRKGRGFLQLEEVDTGEQMKARRFDFLSSIGMGFILAGFVLQAVAIYFI